jgi:hypothetical protein
MRKSGFHRGVVIAWMPIISLGLPERVLINSSTSTYKYPYYPPLSPCDVARRRTQLPDLQGRDRPLIL